MAASDASALLDATVLDVEGKTHRIGDLVKGKPAVLVFLRHFG